MDFWRQIEFTEPAHFVDYVIDAIIDLINSDVSDLNFYLWVVKAEALSAVDVLRVHMLHINAMPMKVVELGQQLFGYLRDHEL